MINENQFTQFEIKLNSLELTNIRSFIQCQVQFDEQLTILIGINGSGKTTILDSILEHLSLVLNEIFLQKKYNPFFSKKDIRYSTESASSKCSLNLSYLDWANSESEDNTIESENDSNRNEDDSNKETTIVPDRILRTVENAESYITFNKRGNVDYEPKILQEISSNKEEYDLSKHAVYGLRFSELYHETAYDNIPIIAYYNCGVINSVTEYGNKPISLKKVLDDVYNESFNTERYSFQNFYDWYDLRYRLYLQDKNDKYGKQVLIVNEAIENFYNDSEYSKIQDVRIKYDLEKSEFCIFKIKNNEKIPITTSQMSAGEKMTLVLVADIAFRLITANQGYISEDKSPLLHGQGIVLIDEIDLHLHPTWQRKIVTKLREIFPNIQFVITTHSPEILSEIKDGTVFKIENGVLSKMYTYGKDLNYLNAEIGDRVRPVSVQQSLDNLFLLINNNQIEEAEREIEVLERDIQDKTVFITAKSLIKRKKLIGR